MSLEKQFFHRQIARLVAVFGAANFHPERQKLVWDQVNDLPNRSFLAIVDHFIGNRKVDWPPMLKDFIEEAHAQRRILKGGKPEGVRVEKSEPWPSGLMPILESIGSKSLVEAITKKKIVDGGR